MKLVIAAGLFFMIACSSCLKDTPYMDVSNTSPIIEFGLSPANGEYGPYGNGLFPYAGDTAGSPNIDTAVALVIASPQVLGKAVTVTVAESDSLVNAYNAANGTNFAPLPANLYTLGTSITIPAGDRVGRIPVTLNLSQFPSSHNYALGLTISGGGGLIISANSGTFIWGFQR